MVCVYEIASVGRAGTSPTEAIFSVRVLRHFKGATKSAVQY